jgi:hypothetical protein
MTIRITSVWQISTGKHDVRLHLLEDANYEHEIREPVELRAFVDQNYKLAAHELAKLLLESVFDAIKVEVFDFNRNGVIMEIEKI